MRGFGLFFRKVGCVSLFDATGRSHAVTLLHMDESWVVGRRTVERNGYDAFVVGTGVVEKKRLSKPLSGVFGEAKCADKLYEVDSGFGFELGVGEGLSVSYFEVGRYVDAVGIGIGKGFAGVMKRHNFHGLEASHGVSLTHRSHGTTGQRHDPGKVWRGMKMAGQMGAKRVSVQSLVVMLVDKSRSLIAVRGSVPGFSGSYVGIKPSVKKPTKVSSLVSAVL